MTRLIAVSDAAHSDLRQLAARCHTSMKHEAEEAIAHHIRRRAKTTARRNEREQAHRAHKAHNEAIRAARVERGRS